jgi:hypothetical protein
MRDARKKQTKTRECRVSTSAKDPDGNGQRTDGKKTTTNTDPDVSLLPCLILLLSTAVKIFSFAGKIAGLSQASKMHFLC